jgi:ATP-dependent Clp protease ATP-binding subunit ClpX
MVQVNTKNILFIAGGAFDGIDKKIARRLNTQAIGYSASKQSDELDKNNLIKYVSPQDLKSYGLIPELIGRFPVLTYLSSLNRETLRRILIEPKNSLIKQYIKLFEIDGIKLSFDKSVLDFIVDKAIEYKLGARGLRSICETIMMDAMFEIPSNKTTGELKITLSYAKDKFNKSSLSRLRAA